MILSASPTLNHYYYSLTDEFLNVSARASCICTKRYVSKNRLAAAVLATLKITYVGHRYKFVGRLGESFYTSTARP